MEGKRTDGTIVALYVRCLVEVGGEYSGKDQGARESSTQDEEFRGEAFVAWEEWSTVSSNLVEKGQTTIEELKVFNFRSGEPLTAGDLATNGGKRSPETKTQ